MKYETDFGAARRLDRSVRKGGGTTDTAGSARAERAGEHSGVQVILNGAALVAGRSCIPHHTIECLSKDCGFLSESGAIAPSSKTPTALLRDQNATFSLLARISTTTRRTAHHCHGGDAALSFGGPKSVIRIECPGVGWSSRWIHRRRKLLGARRDDRTSVTWA
jgi:hypothetical protein